MTAILGGSNSEKIQFHVITLMGIHSIHYTNYYTLISSTFYSAEKLTRWKVGDNTQQKKDSIWSQLLLEKEDMIDRKWPLWSDLLTTTSSRENEEVPVWLKFKYFHGDLNC
jgi:hypothetical protein